MALFQSLLRKQPPPFFSLPPGMRVYAIGDVHGCLDELRDMIWRIQQDIAETPIGRAFVILLGDLIDRGPDSAGVIEYLLQVRGSLPNPVFLTGNHEEMLLRILGGESDIVHNWLTYGGDTCVASYGIDPHALFRMLGDDAVREMRARIPAAHIEFIETFADSFRLGGYLFVHAGVRPGVALKDQTVQDLRWIREDFLQSPDVLPYRVVHGHTIFRKPEEQDYRVGVDTGAYTTGVLTAIRIEGSDHSFLSTAQ